MQNIDAAIEETMWDPSRSSQNLHRKLTLTGYTAIQGKAVNHNIPIIIQYHLQTDGSMNAFLAPWYWLFLLITKYNTFIVNNAALSIPMSWCLSTLGHQQLNIFSLLRIKTIHYTHIIILIIFWVAGSAIIFIYYFLLMKCKQKCSIPKYTEVIILKFLIAVMAQIKLGSNLINGSLITTKHYFL